MINWKHCIKYFGKKHNYLFEEIFNFICAFLINEVNCHKLINNDLIYNGLCVFCHFLTFFKRIIKQKLQKKKPRTLLIVIFIFCNCIFLSFYFFDLWIIKYLFLRKKLGNIIQVSFISYMLLLLLFILQY